MERYELSSSSKRSAKEGKARTKKQVRRQRELAAELDLSISTVSRALRGSRLVSAETRRRVIEAAKAGNYRTASLAAAVRLIGVCLPRPRDYALKNPYFFELIRGIQAALAKYEAADRWQFTIWDQDALTESVLATWSGVILTSPEESDIRYEMFRGKPTVVLNSEGAGEVMSVIPDSALGNRILVDHLLIQGHSSIAFLGRRAVHSSVRRLEGYLAALRDAGIEPEAAWIVDSDGFGFEDGFKCCERLWRSAEKPTAVVAFNDYMAMGAIKWLTDHGLRIPEDVSVAGFDGVPLYSQALGYQLTTVDQLAYQQGHTAATMLLSEVSGHRVQPRKVVVSPHMVLGQSTGHTTNLHTELRSMSGRGV